MFTGIVKAKGAITAMHNTNGDVRMTVEADGLPWSTFEIGESISVNGVCLTAVELSKRGFATDVSRETLDVTCLADLAVGSAVNLEPSLAVGDRLGGHLVSGHVDGIGQVVELRRDARSWRLSVSLPDELMRYVARKGSVCVDGVSLTINEVSASRFDVNIIPHTADATIIGAYRVGTRVNVEVDQLARYLERLLSDNANDGLSREILEANGYG